MILSAKGLLKGMRDICQDNVNCRDCPLNLYHCATPDDEIVDIVTSYIKSQLKEYIKSEFLNSQCMILTSEEQPKTINKEYHDGYDDGYQIGYAQGKSDYGANHFLDKIISEINLQEEWISQVGYTDENVHLVFYCLRKVCLEEVRNDKR